MNFELLDKRQFHPPDFACRENSTTVFLSRLFDWPFTGRGSRLTEHHCWLTLTEFCETQTSKNPMTLLSHLKDAKSRFTEHFTLEFMETKSSPTASACSPFPRHEQAVAGADEGQTPNPFP